MIRRRRMRIYRTAAGSLAAPEIDGNFAFRALTAGDFERNALGREKGRAPAFAKRLDAGHRAYGFVSGEEVANYLWLSGPSYGTARAPFECRLVAALPAGTAYAWDCRTDPRFEGRGLYRRGLAALDCIASAAGNEYLLIAVQRENRRSCRAIESVGFVFDSEMTLLRIGGFVVRRSAKGLTLHRRGTAVRLA